MSGPPRSRPPGAPSGDVPAARDRTRLFGIGAAVLAAGSVACAVVAAPRSGNAAFWTWVGAVVLGVAALTCLDRVVVLRQRARRGLDHDPAGTGVPLATALGVLAASQASGAAGHAVARAHGDALVDDAHTTRDTPAGVLPTSRDALVDEHRTTDDVHPDDATHGTGSTRAAADPRG